SASQATSERGFVRTASARSRSGRSSVENLRKADCAIVESIRSPHCSVVTRMACCICRLKIADEFTLHQAFVPSCPSPPAPGQLGSPNLGVLENESQLEGAHDFPLPVR